MHYHLNDCHESQLLPARLIRGKYTSNLILKYIFCLCILLCAKKIRSQPDGQCCCFVARRFPKCGGLVGLYCPAVDWKGQHFKIVLDVEI